MKGIYRQVYFIVAWLFSKTVLLLPYRICVKIGSFLGLLGYYAAGSARRTALEGIRKAFPEKTAAEASTIVKEVFVNQGKNIFELFSFPKMSKQDISAKVKIYGGDNFKKAFEAGKGVLIASAHCGNWEIMGAALACAGFPINVIARRIYIEGLNSMLVGLRVSKGVKVILRSGQESAKEILRSLRHNEAIGILIDQDTKVPGVFVDFFGRKAWTPSGLATLSVRTGAKVVLALDVRNSDDSHEVVLTGPFDFNLTGDNDKDVVTVTQLITAKTEEHIRKYPSQWVWMHERWKTVQI